MSLINLFEKSHLKTNNPDVRPGDLIKVYQKNLDKEGGKPQVFEGIVLAKKHGKGLTSTITVRKEVKGIGVERIFPLHSPLVEKIEIVKRGKVRRAKLYYLRWAKGKKKRVKTKNVEDSSAPQPAEATEETVTEDQNVKSSKEEDQNSSSDTKASPTATEDSSTTSQKK